MKKDKKFWGFFASFVLGLFLFYPFIFCPFGIPYLYCSICHVKCPWGVLRGILLLGILGLNLKGEFYCSSLCPCGKIQDLESKIKVKKITLPFQIYRIKYLILALTILYILSIRGSFLFIIDRHLFFFLMGLVLLASLFSYRFWCLVFCPIAALTQLILRIKEKIGI